MIIDFREESSLISCVWTSLNPVPAETAEESACASDVLTAAKVLLQLLSKVDSANKSVVLAATMLEFKLLTNEAVKVESEVELSDAFPIKRAFWRI